MSFKSARPADSWYGLGACAGIVLLAALLLRWLLNRPVSGVSFLLVLLVLAAIPVFAYIAYRTLALFLLEYWVDRDAVTIVWGPIREVIPIGTIRRIERQGFDGLRGLWWEWPNPFFTQGHIPDVGPVLSLSTRPAAEQLVLVTDQAAYAISPAAPEALIEAIQTRYELGPARLRTPGRRWPRVWQWAFWQDRVALGLLGATFLLNLFLFGYLAMRYPYLPADIALHFDAQGAPDRFGPAQSLFVLPLMGLGVMLVNGIWGGWLYRRQRPAAYMLWGGALVIQALVGFALLNLVH